MSLLTNFQDLANSIKLALDRKADKSEIPQTGAITSGNTGWVTGGEIYTELQNIPSMPSGTNTGDILVWDGDEWVSKPKWKMIYQPCEYIESSGTQYIDLSSKGYAASVSNETVAVADLQFMQVRNDFQMCASTNRYRGSSDSSTVTLNFGVAQSGGSEDGCLQYNFTNFSNYAFVNLDKTQFAPLARHTLSFKSGEQKVDNTITSSVALTNGTSDLAMTLFARKEKTSSIGTSYLGKAYMRLYRYTQTNPTESGLDSFDLIPVYNISTGEAGLFDLVHNVFYGNNGSGLFAHGADVN